MVSVVPLVGRAGYSLPPHPGGRLLLRDRDRLIPVGVRVDIPPADPQILPAFAVANAPETEPVLAIPVEGEAPGAEVIPLRERAISRVR